MAVFKQELNWSTYQDKQLSVLESLERSFSSSLRTSKLIEDNLSRLKSAIDSMVGANKSIAETLSEISAFSRHRSNASQQSVQHSTTPPRQPSPTIDNNIVNTQLMSEKLGEAASALGNFQATTKGNILVYDKYNGVLDYTAKRQEEYAIEQANIAKQQEEAMEEANRHAEEIRKREEELAHRREEVERYAQEEARRRAQAEEDSLERQREILASMSSLLDSATTTARNIGRIVDDYSTASNHLIRLTGVSGDTVREFRSEFLDQVSDLNKVTGSAYNSLDQYEKIIAVTQGVTSNLESLSEMSRPLMLAQETLDVNISDIADLFNKFYTRYRFSSSNMESSLNEIRGNTAGNSANAEATLKNIKSLENWINYSSKNDNARREEMMKSISHYTSWLESMEIDSAPYTEYLNAIAYGDYEKNPELANILTRAGLSTTQATEMAWDGQFEELTKAMIEGIYSAFDTVDGSYAMGAAIDNLRIDRDMALEAWNTINSSGFVGLDEFMEKVSQPQPTMVDLVEDKYVSLTEKTNNWLSAIYGHVASIQERFGIGLSDIAGIYVLFKGASGIFENISRLFTGNSGSNFLQTLGANNAIRGAHTTDLMLDSIGNSSVLGKAASSSSAGLGKVAALGGGIGGAAMLAGGVAAGAGLAIDGGKDLFSQETDAVTKGLSAAELLGGAGGIAGLIGLGVTNPIGWAALAIGGVAMLGKSIHKAATTIGETKGIEKAYEEARKTVIDQSKGNEDILLQVKAGLESGLELESMRASLIESGILSENDIETARNANKEGLIKLTKAYLEAAKEFSTDYQLALDKYQKSDIEYASELKESLFEVLQELNDGKKLTEGSQELEAVDSLFYSLYKDLSTQKANGLELDKDTEKIYDQFVKAYADGNLSQKEANSIIDAGIWNTTFKNANFGVESLVDAVSKLAATNDVGSQISGDVIPKDKVYYGSEEASHVLELATKALNATNQASAIEYIDKLVAEGYSLTKYSEVEDAIRKWNLSGMYDIESNTPVETTAAPIHEGAYIAAYDEGSNYITRDQVALIHEGEAVVPKKYNPAANVSEISHLTEQLLTDREQKMREYQETKESMSLFIEELRDIKEFLAVWKSDSARRESMSEIRNRHSTSKSMIQQYLAY